MKTYNKTNFFKHTYCIFNEVSSSELPREKPDYISKSKSSYYFTEFGVYRKSNHWGRAANCRWKLISTGYKSQNEIIAYARWIDFFPNNETEKIFFISIDSNSQVSFNHKNDISFKESDFLRTASETTKRIKLIKEVLETTSWSKYIEHTNFELLKKEIINQLLNSNKTFLELKKELNGKI